METYQATTDPNTIIRLSDGAFIPCNPNNTDYQIYLAWVADVNTITPVPDLQDPSA